MPIQARNNVIPFRPRSAGRLKQSQHEVFSQEEFDDYVSFQTMRAIADKELERMYGMFCDRVKSGAVSTHKSLQFDTVLGFVPIDASAAI